MSTNRSEPEAGQVNVTDGAKERPQHTPGPWHVGWTMGQHLRHGEDYCTWCNDKHLLVRTRTEPSPDPREFQDTVHVHLFANNAADFRTIVSNSGEQVVGMYDYGQGGVCTSMADARLIAAVPDLLEALRQAVIVLESIADTHNYDISIGAVPQARAAIAKAEGRSA